MHISKALLRKAEVALNEAIDKEKVINIPGTAMSLCPREMVAHLPQFKVFTYITQHDRSFVIGMMLA